MQTQQIRGLVLVHPGHDEPVVADHSSATHEAVARRLADVRGWTFGGAFEPGRNYGEPVYLVPSQTLSTAWAQRHGVASESALFGGVVERPFMATKTITHVLPYSQSKAPMGWSDEFGERVADVVLPGYSAFSRDDATSAGFRLLERGACRVKLADGIGGAGQFVVRSKAELVQRLDALSEQALAQGVVLEVNLEEVSTLSVGMVKVGDASVAYVGIQNETVNNHGHRVYGGSEITAVRGGFEALLQLDVPPKVREGCRQALVYDDAARRCFSGLLATRCNYDVAQGVDAAGAPRSGVLEQSWRIGGASGAEVAALLALKNDPGLHCVVASTTERYGDDVVVPPGADVLFRGVDAGVGMLTKYVEVR